MNIQESQLQFNGTPATRSETRAIVLHHADAVSCTVEDVHRWHLSNGWIGIGYHFFVRKDGSIWRGRPLHWVGAHAKGANDFSVGVCFEGSYESKDTAMPDPQLQSGKELVAYLLLQFPGAAVKRHKDYCATDCPGKYFPFAEMAQGAGSAPEQPAPVDPTPAPVSHSLLVRGSKGEEVRQLQQRLLSLGYACGRYGADGVYGAGTLFAVQSFQMDNGLAIDGKCGEKTWAALDGNPGPAALCPYPEPAGNIKRGSKGDGVRWVQWWLVRHGQDIGSTGIDGDCGAKTAAAITAFQRSQGIAADGICGKDTRARLKGV